MTTLSEKIKATAAFLKEKGMTEPEFGLILGSGLGELASEIENAVSLDYADIPSWGRSTVVGDVYKRQAYAGLIVLIVFMSLAGGLLSIHRVLKIDPITAIGGE